MNYKEYPHNKNYLVYDDGKVFSVPRKGANNSNRKGRFLKESFDKRGYARVTLSPNQNTIAVHRMVAITFIANPDNLPQVNHKDGNKLNNKAENLEWCTNAENMAHAIKIGLRPDSIYARGESQGNVKLSESDVIAIRKRYIPRHPLHGNNAIAREYGMNPATINEIIHRKIWCHIN